MFLPDKENYLRTSSLNERYLVKEYGCQVGCLNLSETQNKRNRELNRKAGISLAINVIDGNFEDIPLSDGSVDLAWSQDALLHSGDRQKVFEEVSQVLAKGGNLFSPIPCRAQSVRLRC